MLFIDGVGRKKHYAAFRLAEIAGPDQATRAVSARE
jgi:hypothetical protein